VIRLSKTQLVALTQSNAQTTARPRSPRLRQKRKKPLQSEAALKTEVLAYLTRQSIWHQRLNAGTQFVAGRRIELCAPGTADLLIIHDGRAIFCELKTSTGRLRATQKVWRERVEKAGATYLVIRSLDDLIEQLTTLGVIT